MGGDATAVSDDTKNIYIEAAFWFPKAVAGRSRHFNFSTDAGHLSPEGTGELPFVQRVTNVNGRSLELRLRNSDVYRMR